VRHDSRIHMSHMNETDSGTVVLHIHISTCTSPHPQSCCTSTSPHPHAHQYIHITTSTSVLHIHISTSTSVLHIHISETCQLHCLFTVYTYLHAVHACMHMECVSMILISCASCILNDILSRELLSCHSMDTKHRFGTGHPCGRNSRTE